MLCCAKTTGSHRVKLTSGQGKGKKPHFYKETGKTVNFLNQKGTWMLYSIFKTVCKFVPQVYEDLKSRCLPEKTMLLLNNAPSHPNENVLKSDDCRISVIYLPPSVIVLIQPM
jgi:hypothetical protein